MLVRQSAEQRFRTMDKTKLFEVWIDQLGSRNEHWMGWQFRAATSEVAALLLHWVIDRLSRFIYFLKGELSFFMYILLDRHLTD